MTASAEAPAPSSAMPSAPWLRRQLAQLLAQRGHAWLLQGPSGLGQYELGLALAQAWLCEQPTPDGACGQCGSCHLVASRGHPDLVVLMPETVLLALGWPLSESAQKDIDDKKRKPSKEIRVDAMRSTVEFAQRTSARGRGTVVLVYPAERMNTITANALLKTLEEPPGDTRFVLASDAAHQLLPTIRSRCQTHTLRWPDATEAQAWLAGQGVAAGDATTWLRAAGGRPADALALARSGRSAAAWGALPKAMSRGEVTALADLAPPQALDALHKLCHDALACKMGAAPRFFAAADLPGALLARTSVASLTRWSRALAQAARTVEHPFNPGLMLESLVNEARLALNSEPSRP
ncbi:MAG: DNA polymerase III subunit delta' [Burkholderiaceae bacterium]|nr:DNA polymerase III subunit delta' [Burkholderiaceae bacterium]MDZ4144866.1 DNA polymerase III subunit delta' [Burkholderiales bacterium]